MLNYKIRFLLCILLPVTMFTQACRRDELDSSGAPDILNNPSRGIFQLLLAGLSPSGFGGGGSGTYRLLKVSSSGLMFIFLGAFGSGDGTLYSSGDGTNFVKKTIKLPNCSPTSSNSGATTCNIVGIEFQAGTYTLIGQKQVSVFGSSGETITERKFYFGQGSDLATLTLAEITDSNISTASTQRFDTIKTAVSGSTVFFGIEGVNGGANGKVCFTTNGSSWACQVNTSGSATYALEDLNGTLMYGAGFRWNGSSFTNTTNTFNPFKSSFIGGRTHFDFGNNLAYTVTDPSLWTNGTTFTNSTESGFTSGFKNTNFFSLNGKPSIYIKVNCGTNCNSTPNSLVQSSDNGVTYTVSGTASSTVPDYSFFSLGNALVFNGKVFAIGDITPSSTNSNNRRYVVMVSSDGLSFSQVTMP
jgi:hypothetical protein